MLTHITLITIFTDRNIINRNDCVDGYGWIFYHFIIN